MCVQTSVHWAPVLLLLGNMRQIWRTSTFVRCVEARYRRAKKIVMHGVLGSLGQGLVEEVMEIARVPLHG